MSRKLSALSDTCSLRRELCSIQLPVLVPKLGRYDLYLEFVFGFAELRRCASRRIGLFSEPLLLFRNALVFTAEKTSGLSRCCCRLCGCSETCSGWSLGSEVDISAAARKVSGTTFRSSPVSKACSIASSGDVKASAAPASARGPPQVR